MRKVSRGGGVQGVVAAGAVTAFDDPLDVLATSRDGTPRQMRAVLGFGNNQNNFQKQLCPMGTP